MAPKGTGRPSASVPALVPEELFPVNPGLKRLEKIAFLERGGGQRGKTGLAVILELGALYIVEEECFVVAVIDLR